MKQHRLAIPSNVEYSVPQLWMMISRTRQELIDKLSDMYLGYDRIYSILEREGLVEAIKRSILIKLL